MNVAVVGCGYVGLVTGVCLASIGHDVVGIETDPERCDSIARAIPPFHEPGLEDLLRDVLATARFRVAGDPGLVRDADVILLAVQTPPTPDGSIDRTFLEDAARRVAAELADAPDRPRVVAIRSTVLPGTAARVQRLLEGRAPVASNPEFLREGSAVADVLQADRIVLGCDDDEGRRLLVDLYEPLGAPIVLTSPETAETAKYASNALLATMISFSNEIARVCESLPGVDVETVLGILHRDRRLAPVVDGVEVQPGILSYLKAGAGFGGSCLPKDLSALVADQAAQGHDHPLLRAVLAVNDAQPSRVVDQLEQRLGMLAGRSVAVLGAAFKAGTDDTRESPGLTILERLLDRGARALVYDPLVGAAALASFEARGAVVADHLRDAIDSAEACIVTTAAPEFQRLPELLAERRNGKCLVLDARRVLDPASFGDEYLAVGRGPQS